MNLLFLATYTYQRKFIGNSAIPHGERDTWNNAMYIPNPDKYMPADGYIYRWRFYAKTAGVIIYLQVSIILISNKTIYPKPMCLSTVMLKCLQFKIVRFSSTIKLDLYHFVV